MRYIIIIHQRLHVTDYKEEGDFKSPHLHDLRNQIYNPGQNIVIRNKVFLNILRFSMLRK